MESDLLKGLQRSRSLIIKVGSSLLIDAQGRLDRDWLMALCEDIVQLRRGGSKVAVVSSGAVALGAQTLSLSPSRVGLVESQAAAAIGQVQLAHAYQEALSSFGLAAAQVLLTLDDSENRRRYLNARGTLTTLLDNGVVPVVNENDTVATTEIRYGDNDRLAARVAQMLACEHLILLSDVDGLYTADPQVNPSAVHVPVVTSVDETVRNMASGPTTHVGSGGMSTKLDAATTALAAGCHMVIASGRVTHPIQQLLDGARATWFVPDRNPTKARKQWIAGTLKPRGTLQVDDGAAAALRAGKSLLPAGVVAVEGDFDKGDAVLVATRTGEVARGLVAYPADEARRIAGHQSNQVAEVLGYRGRKELIHRDDLVLTVGSER